MQPITGSAPNYALHDALEFKDAPGVRSTINLLEDPGVRFCPQHPENRLTYLCPDDLAICCAECIITEHHGHTKSIKLTDQEAFDLVGVGV